MDPNVNTIEINCKYSCALQSEALGTPIKKLQEINAHTQPKIKVYKKGGDAERKTRRF
jgi:hypothetical protein